MFKDRKDAGNQLAKLISRFKDNKNAIVVGIPRGGAVVAQEIAKQLRIPLFLILVKKISHPMNNEVAIGAVSLTDVLIENSEKYDNQWLSLEIEKKRNRIREMMELYQIDPVPKVKDKIVFLVDDGIATGHTIQLSINELKKKESKKLNVVVPICPVSLKNKFENQVETLISLYYPAYFHAIGEFYMSFNQIEDEEVIHLLTENKIARG